MKKVQTTYHVLEDCISSDSYQVFFLISWYSPPLIPNTIPASPQIGQDDSCYGAPIFAPFIWIFFRCLPPFQCSGTFSHVIFSSHFSDFSHITSQLIFQSHSTHIARFYFLNRTYQYPKFISFLHPPSLECNILENNNFFFMIHYCNRSPRTTSDTQSVFDGWLNKYPFEMGTCCLIIVILRIKKLRFWKGKWQVQDNIVTSSARLWSPGYIPTKPNKNEFIRIMMDAVIFKITHRKL